MKKIYVLIEFLILFFFLMVPPFFTEPSSAVIDIGGHINISLIIEFLIVAVLVIQKIKFFYSPFFSFSSKSESDADSHAKRNKNFFLFVNNLRWGTLTFGILVVIYSAFKLISLKFFLQAPYDAEPNVIFPDSPAAWILQILIFFIAALNEEVLYRYFFPEFLLVLTDSVPQKLKIFTRIFIEILSSAVFCLAHRYMGWAAVLNAFCASVILRIAYVRTQSVVAGCSAHFLYNVLQLVISFLVANSAYI